ncbi:MAG TPA: 30S ribosomal protein S8 [Bacteroidia bacterium]|nr:30S ribosomal protein S8 [Bacteroidia bacterium]HRS58994.1 30S ribosomal protein S8 [Bacteroidia bacterium]HRU67517.1 30S ribosomal protein S8 [Bacteroidia bacterium]
MDSIGDFLTIIRNASKARKRIIEVEGSFMKNEITRILFEQGYILNYKIENTSPSRTKIKIALKYDPITGISAIKKIGRISTPGLRQYRGKDELPRIINGLGIAIVSTSKGIMTDKEARKNNVGGELICYVY